MARKYNYKRNLIPTKWFFFDTSKNEDVIYSLSKKVGVVFFCSYNCYNYSFFKELQPFIFHCRKNKIKFVIPFSYYWANKYKPFGVMVEQKSFLTKNLKILENIKRRFCIVSKIHSIKEAKELELVSDIVFISPIFSTSSHPNQKPLKNYLFLYLCHLLKRKWIFLLGGMNEKNFKYKKFYSALGFGAITNFKK
jgi:thiamine monophosphate synthase